MTYLESELAHQPRWYQRLWTRILRWAGVEYPE